MMLEKDIVFSGKNKYINGYCPLKDKELSQTSMEVNRISL